MDTTRLRFWILRELNHLSLEFTGSSICSLKTWFQFDDEVVTKIDFLGEKRYTGKDIVDVLNDTGTTKKCVSSPGYGSGFLMYFFCSDIRSAGQPRVRSAKKRRIDDSDDEIVEYVMYLSSSNLPFHLACVHTSFRLPAPTEAKVSLPGKTPEGCVMCENWWHMMRLPI